MFKSSLPDLNFAIILLPLIPTNKYTRHGAIYLLYVNANMVYGHYGISLTLFKPQTILTMTF